MENNFKSWQKKYPHKNFEAFQLEVGTNKTVQTKPKKKFTLKKGLQIAFFIISFSISFFLVKKVTPKIYTYFYELAFPVSELLDKEWSRQYFLNKQVSVSSPFLLEKKDLDLPLDESVKKVILEMENHIYESNPNFNIVLSYATYSASIGKVDLKGASNGTANGAMQELKGTDLFFNDENIFINQYPAILKKGTFNAKGEEFHFKIISCVKKDLTLVNLITFWIGKNENYELLTDRIVNSLEIR
ncbi:hypothetical protein [Wenyingzhuangia sp. 2_MG-2023]|uniref:hypothetical protein n=1 Tax=Wenyingzhuangia sp. 2_MG-2023 TaxID=3062639 RepID=UPI0026E3251B|nr:hypothetical protein [Wenyingzhuangia sp. 2_MG-2023]MDO6737716.1 hypothetical protein [Wenyingzhuangia sp. 2_MG-2023]MDO6802555.1 hypothetical protein [Wenyingzhuangia sp. 1_MG-2023]